MKLEVFPDGDSVAREAAAIVAFSTGRVVCCGSSPAMTKLKWSVASTLEILRFQPDGFTGIVP